MKLISMKIEKLNDIEKAAFYTQIWYSMSTNMGEEVIMKYPVAELNLKNGLEKFAFGVETKICEEECHKTFMASLSFCVIILIRL